MINISNVNSNKVDLQVSKDSSILLLSLFTRLVSLFGYQLEARHHTIFNDCVTAQLLILRGCSIEWEE